MFPLEAALPVPRGQRGPEFALRVQPAPVPVQAVAPLEFRLKVVLPGPEVARRQHPLKVAWPETPPSAEPPERGPRLPVQAVWVGPRRGRWERLPERVRSRERPVARVAQAR